MFHILTTLCRIQLASLAAMVSQADDKEVSVQPAAPPNHTSTTPAIPRYCANEQRIMSELGIQNSTLYDLNRIPEYGMPILVGANVQAISEVNDVTQDFVLDVFMAETWVDRRLAFKHLTPCKRNISLGKEIYEQLWTPNTVFINSKKAYIHESPFKNLFIILFDNGIVWTEYRATLRGPCLGNLASFPMDQQECFLTFESFAYSTDEVKMLWIERQPIKLEAQRRFLKEFYVSHTKASTLPVDYPAGVWDELTMTFVIQRRYGWYILNVYIPTYLTVFISWISFYLGDKAMPARTMIGVNALLAMTFQFGSVISNLPRVSYVKAIDVWMLTGISFVFASLLELAIVGWHSNAADNKKETSKRSQIATLMLHEADQAAITTYQPGCIECDGIGGSFRTLQYQQMTRGRRFSTKQTNFLKRPPLFLGDCSVDKIDRFSAKLFPTLFAIFNVIYWSCYLSVSSAQAAKADLVADQ